MSFDLFVDSSANVPDEYVRRYEINVIPYLCLVNGEEKPAVEEGVPFDKTAEEFYKAMCSGADIKTSLISKERFMEAWLPSLESGRDVFTVTITSSLSGTNAQAVAAAKELSERFPDRTIVVADSCNASLGEGLLAIGVAERRALGMNIEACATWLCENRYNVNSQVTVDDLKFLHRSGRVSGIMAFAGNLLGIKPMLRADGSSPAKLVVYGRQKGRRKSLEEILRAFDENVVDPEKQTVAIAHADCLADAEKLKEELLKRGVKDVIVDYYDVCTGCHVGPGTIALFYYGKPRRTEKPAIEFALFRKRAFAPM